MHLFLCYIICMKYIGIILLYIASYILAHVYIQHFSVESSLAVVMATLTTYLVTQLND